jgi:hypothetical protein
MIDRNVYNNLMRGLFTCYWCGSVKDKYRIGEHVDGCLKEINWLREHVENAELSPAVEELPTGKPRKGR